MSKFSKFLGLFATLATFANSQIFHQDSSVIERFRTWVDTHRIVANDDHHLAHMFENWLSNDKFIFETNAKNLTYTVGHNAFSGMNSDEFAEFMGFRANQELLAKGDGFLRGSVKTVQQEGIMDLESLPTSVDWRTKGVVSEVRDQGQCGSCWAFSGTSTIESAVAIKTGHLYDLSEQQAVSCAGLRYGNLGCNGGMYNNLFNWDKTGICSEASYPYTSGETKETGSCQTTCTPISETKVQSYVTVTPYSDSSMMTALNVEPINIAIQADSKSFQMYKSGIYTDLQGCGNTLDHAVVLVGYSSENGQDYYILRNSWGNWGESGYMRIGRGSQYGKYGMCGLLSEPMYPIV